jgi:hypothetical protein
LITPVITAFGSHRIGLPNSVEIAVFAPGRAVSLSQSYPDSAWFQTTASAGNLKALRRSLTTDSITGWSERWESAMHEPWNWPTPQLFAASTADFVGLVALPLSCLLDSSCPYRTGSRFRRRSFCKHCHRGQHRRHLSCSRQCHWLHGILRRPGRKKSDTRTLFLAP